MNEQEIKDLVEELIKEKLRVTVFCPSYNVGQVIVDLEWEYTSFSESSDCVGT